MKGRDLLILAAIVLVVGFAVADSLRSDDERVQSRETTTDADEAPVTTVEQDEDLGRSMMPAVNGAPGSIVLSEAGSCAVREFDLPTGLELPNVVANSTCDLWAAPVTAKVAVGIEQQTGDAIPFRFVDLNDPGRDLGTSEAAFGFVIWSHDGQRAAWCNARLEGIDLELGGTRRRLLDCPAAYTPAGEVAYATGNRLVTANRELVRASGQITGAHFGEDGSVAVIVEGRRIERYTRRGRTDAFDFPERFEGRTPVLSPDNCTAAFRAGDRIRLLDLGCSTIGPPGSVFPGHAIDWSPDGEWIVVGGATETTFLHIGGDGASIVWPIGAAEIIWRRS